MLLIKLRRMVKARIQVDRRHKLMIKISLMVKKMKIHMHNSMKRNKTKVLQRQETTSVMKQSIT